MSYNNVGKVWTPDSFGEYLKTLKKPEWVTKICLHHCGEPNLAQRPNGFTIQHIQNMKSFYQGLKWTRGPHLFIDDDQVFGMTPLSEQGIHAPDFNRNAIGIEVLGDYDREDPKSGRGGDCWWTTFKTVRVLTDWLGLPIDKDHIVFHRECKVTQRTSRKSCPGTKVDKEWVLEGVKEANPHSLKLIKQMFGVDNPVAAQKNFQSVAQILRQKGYSDTEITTNLRREGKNFFWLDDHLEFAYYDSKLGATMAPASELTNIKNKP